MAKITDKFKVEVKFSGRDSDVVVVRGNNADAIDDACDYIKNLEEEYLQDVVDKEAYVHPSSKQAHNDSASNGPSKGFIVRGAPWEQSNNNNAQRAPPAPKIAAPDTGNVDDFPTITSAVTNGTASAQKMSWGPSRK